MRTHRVTIEIDAGQGSSIGDVQNLIRDAVEAKCKRSKSVFPEKVTAVRIVSAHADDPPDEVT